ncbi:MAG: Ig-like domain-containing protein [Opitutales bacterium]
MRDTTPPALVDTNVLGGPIPVNTLIVLVFTERVNLTSAQRGISVRSSIDAMPVKGVITLENKGREVKFTPIERMTSGAYVLTAIGIKDTAGNVLLASISIFFGAVEVDTTQPVADVIPPRVVSHTPAEGQSLKPTSSVVVRFDEEIDAASAQAGITIPGVAGAVEVTGAVAILKPQKLMPAGRYVLLIAGVKDLAGNALGEALIIPFEVIASPVEEITPPAIGRPSKGNGKVIYLDVAHFIPGDSQFGFEVDGNKWIEVADKDAFGSTAFAGPGDNDRDNANPPGAPFLVIRFPERVRAGESTANGKTWIPWACMRVQTDANSFFWQVSTDKKNWKPKNNTNANRWNDDDRNAGGAKGDGEWYWQDNLTGNDGAIDADLAVGDNYLRIGVRESHPVN